MQFNNRVQFQKPDLEQLNKNHTVVDMHFHSTYSDGLNKIDKIVAKAQQLGIGIAITDHNEIRGALEINQYDILSIPGIELTVSEGSHLLVYFYETEELKRFYEREIKPHMGQGVMRSLSISMKETIERARSYNCVIVFPHPYCAMYTGICNVQFSENERHKLLKMVDGIEVINANNLNKWNMKCAILGFNVNRAMVGGSDGHALNHMGHSVTYAPCPKTRHDFLDSILKRENQVAGKEITLLRKVTSNSLKLRSSLGNCQDLFEKNVRYSRKVIDLKSRAIRSHIKNRIAHHINSENLKSYLGI